MKSFEVRMVNRKAIIICTIVIFIVVFGIVIYIWDFIHQNKMEYLLAIILVPVIVVPIIWMQKQFIAKNEIIVSETELKIRRGNTIKSIMLSDISSLKYYHDPGQDIIYVLVGNDKLKLTLEGKNQGSSFKGILNEILSHGNYKENILMDVEGLKDIVYKKEG